ncbi:acyl-CoA dehydrogenase family protein, partial [Bordetella pertussis]|uniref:acyl-CoA dehydrogenase family protein n=1 Tax=Bordetella pertussis TaxID=520 RepID=UPI000A7897E1
MYSDAFEDLLKGRCEPAVVRAIEAGGDVQALWNAIVQSGFLDLMAPEQAGGAAADLADALPLFTALGAYAVPLPVDQAIALRTLLPRRACPTACWRGRCWASWMARCACWMRGRR